MKQLMFATPSVVSLLAFTASHQRMPVELPKPQQVFWQELQNLCSNPYEGTVMTSPANDTNYTKKLVIGHLLSTGLRANTRPFIGRLSIYVDGLLLTDVTPPSGRLV